MPRPLWCCKSILPRTWACWEPCPGRVSRLEMRRRYARSVRSRRWPPAPKALPSRREKTLFCRTAVRSAPGRTDGRKQTHSPCLTSAPRKGRSGAGQGLCAFWGGPGAPGRRHAGVRRCFSPDSRQSFPPRCARNHGVRRRKNAAGPRGFSFILLCRLPPPGPGQQPRFPRQQTPGHRNRPDRVPVPARAQLLSFSTRNHGASSERHCSPRIRRTRISAAMRPTLYFPWEREVIRTGERSE